MTIRFNRVMLAALGATALSACAIEQPQYPIRQDDAAAPTPAAPVAQPAPPPANDSRVMDDDRTGPAKPTGVVTAQALAPVDRPPAPSDDADSAPPVASAPPRPIASPPRRPKPAPPAPIRYLVTGSLKPSPDKALTIKVEKGDTVNLLAAHYMATKKTIVAANKLKKPYDLDVGQPLDIPTPKAYEVQSGDTLYAISHRFNVPADLLAELNDMGVGQRLHPGQKIVLPVNYKDSGPIKAPGQAAESSARASSRSDEADQGAASPPARTRPYRRINAPPSSVAAVPEPDTEVKASASSSSSYGQGAASPPYRGGPSTSAAAPLESSSSISDAQVAAAGRGRFAWPLRGDQLAGFGPKAGGQRNDGVDLAAPLGTPVLAAAPGDVVVAGTQVPGYGTLVLVKHDGGWVTVYTHLSKTEVKIRDHVSQGDELGQVGQTGGADQPELHFEIRYAPTSKDKAKPIDPILVLPH